VLPLSHWPTFDPLSTHFRPIFNPLLFSCGVVGGHGQRFRGFRRILRHRASSQWPCKLDTAAVDPTPTRTRTPNLDPMPNPCPNPIPIAGPGSCLCGVCLFNLVIKSKQEAEKNGLWGGGVKCSGVVMVAKRGQLVLLNAT